MVGPARVTTGRCSAIRRLPACLHLRDERTDLRVREAERCAPLFRGLRGERQDPAERHALAIVRGHGERLGGRLRGCSRIEAPWLVGGFHTGEPLCSDCLRQAAAWPRSGTERTCIAGAMREVNLLRGNGLICRSNNSAWSGI